jgi:hypothetical protein
MRLCELGRSAVKAEVGARFSFRRQDRREHREEFDQMELCEFGVLGG